MTWDCWFMSMAYLVGMKSKDRSSCIGSVIVSRDNEIISVGYNGFPRKVRDNVEKRHERPAKYLFSAHSERNSVYAAAKLGSSTQDCRLYTLGCPCCGCAVAIIQSGIEEVVVSSLWENFKAPTNHPGFAEARRRWDEEAEVSREMFHEAGVRLRIYSGPLITELKGKFSGEDFLLDTAS